MEGLNILTVSVLIFVLTLSFTGVYGSCPEQCDTCKYIFNTRNIRVKCGGTEDRRIRNLNELEFDEDRSAILFLYGNNSLK